MHRLILSVLLASSVAMPALAQDREGRERDRGSQGASSEQRDEARAARRAERDQRPERAEHERPERVEGERPRAVDGEDRRARIEARRQALKQGSEAQVVRRPGFEQRVGAGEPRNWGQRRSDNDGMTAAIERQQAAALADQQRQSIVQQRGDRRDGRGRDGARVGDAIERSRTGNGQIVVNRDRDVRSHSRNPGSSRQWNNHWRGDRNYDWRDHRNRNRSVFRMGDYWDPYGSRYRRFSIGFNLFPSYYQSNYWLDDPSMYRLPRAYGPYRWVRYYDDALLVNIYSGQVVDVVHSFFW